MTKSSLSDLKDHLFAQLDRLANGDLDADGIEREVKRADAIVGVADQITRGAELQLRAAKLYADHGKAVLPMLPQIGKATATDGGEE